MWSIVNIKCHSQPVQYNIDIDGTINATKLKGDGANIHNINLSDKSTSFINEGSNLYYTEERLYDFLAERYFSFFFEKNLKIQTWPYVLLKNEIHEI